MSSHWGLKFESLCIPEMNPEQEIRELKRRIEELEKQKQTPYYPPHIYPNQPWMPGNYPPSHYWPNTYVQCQNLPHNYATGK